MGNDLIEPGQLISLYLELEPSTDVDLEVAAEAAIEWSQTLKAAARAVNPDFEYRVNLIATEKGSNKWLAKIERLPINQNALTLKQRWENTPFIIRAAISLASVLVVTAKPTYDAYFPDDGLTETQKVEFKEIVDKAISDSSVQSHKKTMYRKTQRDKNISGVGGGVPDGPNWKPSEIVPRTRFAEGDGLFELQLDNPKLERVITPTLDVILVAPNLDNPKLAWVFRQEGIPGTFRASMRDEKFLGALERQAVRESLRAHIPMTIRLQIKQIHEAGEWKVKRRGRTVIEVISPEAG